MSITCKSSIRNGLTIVYDTENCKLNGGLGCAKTKNKTNDNLGNKALK